MKRERRGPLSKIGWFLAAALVLAGCALNGWINLPVKTIESVIQIKGNLEGYVASPLKDRQVKVTLPVELVSGVPVPLEITILPASSADEPVPSDVNYIEGRLELPEVDIFPSESVRTPYFNDKPVSYRWLVTATEPSAKVGRIWLYVDRKSSLSGNTLMPVLARPIELSVRSFLGLSGSLARWIGLGLAGSGFAWAGLLLLRRKTKK